jgi:hypothetical protein
MTNTKINRVIVALESGEELSANQMRARFGFTTTNAARATVAKASRSIRMRRPTRRVFALPSIVLVRLLAISFRLATMLFASRVSSRWDVNT